MKSILLTILVSISFSLFAQQSGFDGQITIHLKNGKVLKTSNQQDNQAIFKYLMDPMHPDRASLERTFSNGLKDSRLYQYHRVNKQSHAYVSINFYAERFDDYYDNTSDELKQKITDLKAKLKVLQEEKLKINLEIYEDSESASFSCDETDLSKPEHIFKIKNETRVEVYFAKMEKPCSKKVEDLYNKSSELVQELMLYERIANLNSNGSRSGKDLDSNTDRALSSEVNQTIKE